jgi:hypothetical protein
LNITSNPTSTNPTVVSNLPSTLQENNNGNTLSTTAEEDDDVLLSKLSTPTLPSSKDGSLIISNYIQE